MSTHDKLERQTRQRLSALMSKNPIAKVRATSPTEQSIKMMEADQASHVRPLPWKMMITATNSSSKHTFALLSTPSYRFFFPARFPSPFLGGPLPRRFKAASCTLRLYAKHQLAIKSRC